MPTNALVMASLLSLIPPSWNSNVRVDFRVVDDSGGPISNAVIRTRTQRDRIVSMGHTPSPKLEVLSVTDGGGRAVARFPCYDGQFSSSVHADGFYGEMSGDVLFRRASDGIFVEHLLEHHKNMLIVLRRKINPIPMYHNRTRCLLKVPGEKGRFGFDIRENDWVGPYGVGLVSDFEVEYSRSETNGITRTAGALLFPGAGDGAYKMKKMPFSYCSVYDAAVSAAYRQRIDFAREVTRTNFIERTDILEEDEYLVLRTRTKVDADGRIVSANYSKIYGKCACDTLFYFQESFFNPTPNDTNLEFDESRNLAPRRRRR